MDEDFAGPLDEGVRRYQALGWPRPEVLLVSGSGLAVDLDGAAAGPLPLQELVPFPIHAVEGHPLEVVLLSPPGGRPTLYQRGRLKLDELVTATYKIEDAPRAFEDLEKGVNARGVIVL